MHSSSNVPGGAPWNVAIADYVGAIHVESAVPEAFSAIAGDMMGDARAARADPRAAGATRQPGPAAGARPRPAATGYDPTPRPVAWVTVPPLEVRTESVGDAIRSVITGTSSKPSRRRMAHGGDGLEPVEREYGEILGRTRSRSRSSNFDYARYSHGNCLIFRV